MPPADVRRGAPEWSAVRGRQENTPNSTGRLRRSTGRCQYSTAVHRTLSGLPRQSIRRSQGSTAVHRTLSGLHDRPQDALRAPRQFTERFQDSMAVHWTLSGSHDSPPARRAVGHGGSRLLRTGCHRWGQGGPAQPLDPATPNKGRPGRHGGGQCSSAGGGGSGSGAPSQKRHHR